MSDPTEPGKAAEVIEQTRRERKECISPPRPDSYDGRPRFVAEEEPAKGGSDAPAANPSAGQQQTTTKPTPDKR